MLKKSTLTLILSALLLTFVTPYLNAHVMMEGFYWNVPNSWYTTMQAKASGLANMAGGYGINRIWFPPPSKGASGGYSMGYDVCDYYDVGQYNQEGTVPTRFGTQAQLKSAIAAYNAVGVSCMADIVLNHRTGGGQENNPNTGGSSWTNFSNVASGQCTWHYNEFHPSTFEGSDEGTFGGYPDICHSTGNSAGHAYYDLIHWGQWLQNSANAGFDGGWRFDYVKGYHPWMSKDFRSNTGSPFCVGEYWDTNMTNLDNWVSAAGNGISVFDFPLYYTLKDICNNTGGGGYLPNLFDTNLNYAARNPLKSVTFVANQDTDEIISDKMLAYAFIITYKGYPCIFWKDYFDYGLASGGGNGSGWGNGIKQLVWCREKVAGGTSTIEILKSNDSDCIIYGSLGLSSNSPGYIVVINDNSSNWKGFTVTTGNSYLKGKTLKAYAWSSSIAGQNTAPNNQNCDSSGNVQVWAAPRGYAVYSVNGQ